MIVELQHVEDKAAQHSLGDHFGRFQEESLHRQGLNMRRFDFLSRVDNFWRQILENVLLRSSQHHVLEQRGSLFARFAAAAVVIVVIVGPAFSFSQFRIQKIHDGPQFARRVRDGRPGEPEAEARVDPRRVLVDRRCIASETVRLVDDSDAEHSRREELVIGSENGRSCDEDARTRDLELEALRLRSLVLDERKRGRPALELAPPRRRRGQRSDDEVRSGKFDPSVEGVQEAARRCGFSEPLLVAQKRAHSARKVSEEEVDAVDLVVSEVEAGRERMGQRVGAEGRDWPNFFEMQKRRNRSIVVVISVRCLLLALSDETREFLAHEGLECFEHFSIGNKARENGVLHHSLALRSRLFVFPAVEPGRKRFRLERIIDVGAVGVDESGR